MNDVMTVVTAVYNVAKGIFKVGMAAGAAAGMIIATAKDGEVKEIKIIIK